MSGFSNLSNAKYATGHFLLLFQIQYRIQSSANFILLHNFRKPLLFNRQIQRQSSARTLTLFQTMEPNTQSAEKRRKAIECNDTKESFSRHSSLYLKRAMRCKVCTQNSTGEWYAGNTRMLIHIDVCLLLQCLVILRTPFPIQKQYRNIPYAQ